MKARTDNNSRNIEPACPVRNPARSTEGIYKDKQEKGNISNAAGSWYGIAVETAIIGGVFSLIVLALFVLNFLQSRVVDPKRAEELETLKIEIQSRPDDEQLLLRIRQLDLKIRQERIRRWDFFRKASFLLLGSVAVFLIGAKCARTYKKKLPAPQLHGDRRHEQLRRAMRARWAVTAGLVMLGSGALFFATRAEIDFSRAGLKGTFYPSMEEISKNWPRFRGPGGLGISAYTNVPANWNGRTGEGILWKTQVPLPGHNSPVVWGDRIFVSGADENKREVYCFDALSGKLLWQRAVMDISANKSEPTEVMEETGFAAPTVVTDGRRVYGIFASGDVGCFDFDGKKVWSRNLGTPDSSYGYASSLAMYRHLLLIQYDQGGVEDEKSRLIALSIFSGQTVWQTKRPVPNSWTSPIVITIGDEHQIITCGDPWVIAYNPANGAELWRAQCLGTDVAPSPIYANGQVFTVEPYAKLVAIRPNGRGDVTASHISWIAEDGIPDICSPVSNGKLIFLLTTEGMLTCYKVTDGLKLWENDLGKNFRASPSLVGDRLYLLSEQGVMFIVEAGTKYKELARCELGEDCCASPAFADGRIYIRGTENLYCIGKGTSPSKTQDKLPQLRAFRGPK